MGPPRRGEARRRHGRWLLLLTFAAAAGFVFATAGLADGPTVEPAETSSGYVWKPAAVSATPGGTVAFRNPGNVVPHGVHWTGGPEEPSCSGVPIDEFGTSWSGTCTFAKAGTYTFVCTVHPEEMKGTIAVAAGEAPALPPEPAQPPAAAEGRVFEALQLAKRQRGRAVHGSATVSSGAVGGRLIVELRAPRPALGIDGTGTVRVGEISRPLAAAGRLSFAVRLKPSARRALQRRGRLSLIVTTVVKTPGGPATTMTRRVNLSE